MGRFYFFLLYLQLIYTNFWRSAVRAAATAELVENAINKDITNNRMKKLLFIGLSALLCQTLNARQLSPQEALSRAEAYPHGRSVRMASPAPAVPVLTVKAPSDPSFTGVYVFSNADQGYMVVSADDCATPLLGYSDRGAIDPANMAPSLKYWLDFYADEISSASKAGMKHASRIQKARESFTRIAPLITTKWDQGSPYNNVCPLDNGKRSVTGCVATAMAQVMNYWEWPVKGTGSHSYKMGGSTISADFSRYTFDWANMLDTYDSSANSTQKKAVAELMYCCGVAVNMYYSTSASGAASINIAPALFEYFGYDKSMATAQRYYYTEEDWESLVYNELANKRPVLYGGNSNEGGHEFVCDGYDSNGYFHFNWGWSGMSDGYYLLSALDPVNQGIGGSNSAFDYAQEIVINMMPAKQNSSVTPLFFFYGNLSLVDLEHFDNKGHNLMISKVDVNLGDQVGIGCERLGQMYGFYNMSCTNLYGSFGLKLVNEKGEATYIDSQDPDATGVNKGWGAYSVILPKNLANGRYYGTPIYKEDGSNTWVDVRVPLASYNVFVVDVANGRAELQVASNSYFEVDQFKFTSPVYLDRYFSADITFSNPTSKSVYAEYSIDLYDASGNYMGTTATNHCISLKAKETRTVNVTDYFPSEYYGGRKLSPGRYYYHVNTAITYNDFYESSETVEVKAAPSDTQISASIKLAEGNGVTTSRHPLFNISVKCDKGYFSGPLIFAAFKSDGSDYYRAVANTYTETLFLDKGVSKNIQMRLSDALEAGDYLVTLYTSFGDPEELDNCRYAFKVDLSGVESVNADGDVTLTRNGDGWTVSAPAGIVSADIYNLEGSNVWHADCGGASTLSIPSSAVSGVAVLLLRNSLGNSVVRKIVR